jgi:hypothetical protein
MNNPDDQQPPPANSDWDWQIRQAAISVATLAAQHDLPQEQIRTAIQTVITGLMTTGNPEHDGALVTGLVHSLGGLTVWALTDYGHATPDQASAWLTDQAFTVQNAAQDGGNP